MQKRIYLASPYTSPDSKLCHVRYLMACTVTAEIMKKGELVFSPIVHSHLLAKRYQLPVHFDFWQNWCLSFLRHWATELYILDMDGWRESKGISIEKRLADEMCLPVFYWTSLMEQYDE